MIVAPLTGSRAYCRLRLAMENSPLGRLPAEVRNNIYHIHCTNLRNDTSRIARYLRGLGMEVLRAITQLTVTRSSLLSVHLVKQHPTSGLPPCGYYLSGDVAYQYDALSFSNQAYQDFFDGVVAPFKEAGVQARELMLAEWAPEYLTHPLEKRNISQLGRCPGWHLRRRVKEVGVKAFKECSKARLQELLK